MGDYWLEFVALATVHLVAVASPGPDFAVVVKHTLGYGRRVAIMTSLGIGTGILLHVAYSLLGIALIIQTTPIVNHVLIFVAAGYFLYIGLNAIRSQTSSVSNFTSNSLDSNTMTSVKAFRIGFVTNGLNPKATLFFLSLFTVIVSSDTPIFIKSMYGIYLALATAVWFSALSMLLSNAKIDQWLQRYKHIIERFMGYLLIFMALSLLYQELL